MWQGSFAPIRKHRLGTGDITNHIEIGRIEYDKVFNEYHIFVEWKDGSGKVYDYVVEAEQYPYYEADVNQLDAAQKINLKRLVARLTTS